MCNPKKLNLQELVDVKMFDGQWYQTEIVERSLVSGGYAYNLSFTEQPPGEPEEVTLWVTPNDFKYGYAKVSERPRLSPKNKFKLGQNVCFKLADSIVLGDICEISKTLTLEYIYKIKIGPGVHHWRNEAEVMPVKWVPDTEKHD